MFEQLDFYVWVTNAQRLEIIHGKQITMSFRVGYDHGGTRPAIDQSHFAKSHAGGKGRQAFARARRKIQEDADVASREEKQLTNLFAFLNQDVSRLISFSF